MIKPEMIELAQRAVNGQCPQWGIPDYRLVVQELLAELKRLRNIDDAMIHRAYAEYKFPSSGGTCGEPSRVGLQHALEAAILHG